MADLENFIGYVHGVHTVMRQAENALAAILAAANAAGADDGTGHDTVSIALAGWEVVRIHEAVTALHALNA